MAQGMLLNAVQNALARRLGARQAEDQYDMAQQRMDQNVQERQSAMARLKAQIDQQAATDLADRELKIRLAEMADKTQRYQTDRVVGGRVYGVDQRTGLGRDKLLAEEGGRNFRNANDNQVELLKAGLNLQGRMYAADHPRPYAPRSSSGVPPDIRAAEGLSRYTDNKRKQIEAQINSLSQAALVTLQKIPGWDKMTRDAQEAKLEALKRKLREDLSKEESDIANDEASAAGAFRRYLKQQPAQE